MYQSQRDIDHAFDRLQALIDAVCLRRTKKDEIAPGKPLVTLPPKTIEIKELEFTRDEQIVYDAYHNKAEQIVRRYAQIQNLFGFYLQDIFFFKY